MTNQVNSDFAAFRNTLEEVPAGTYKDAHAVREAIGEAVDGLINRFRALGFPVCNSDGAHNVEAVIFDWVRQTGMGDFESLIGIGQMDSDASRLAIYNLHRDANFLKQAGFAL
jgi:hypothetical protein